MTIEVLRYVCVAAFGLVLDTAVAWSLNKLGGVPLPLASACGFLLAAAANYALHEIWTFRQGARQLSWRRGVAYVAAMVVTLGARVLAVYLLERVLPPAEFALLILMLGAVVSFLVNYPVSKFLVFAPAASAGRPSS